MGKKVKISLIKSPIGHQKKIRDTVYALGLRKMNQVVEKELNPAVEGMIKKVDFMLKIDVEG